MSKFKVGDKVRHKPSGYIGIIESCIDEDGYFVQYPDDEEKYYVCADDIDFVDERGVFMMRLQALLRDLNAEIVSGAEGSDTSWIDVYINGKCVITFDGENDENWATITPDNIMDFDKD